MRARILLLAGLALLAAPALGQESIELKANDAALAFLASLGDKPDERVFGEVHLVFFDSKMPIGESSYRVSPEALDGRPCYRFEMDFHIELENGARNDMKAWALLTPDLKTLRSESREEQVGENRLVRVVTASRDGDTVTVTRTVNDQTKTWTVKAPVGLIDSGAEPLLVALLALAGKTDGRLLFVTRQQDCILPLFVEPAGKGMTEVTAGTYETITTKISTFRFDIDAGVPAKSPEGRPILESRTYNFTPAGRPVRWAIGDTPLHLEIRPASGAPGTPIGTVSAFLRAWAGKDEQTLLSLIEWKSVFEEWSKGPGAAELAGKSEQEIAAIRDGFPPDFVHGMAGSVTESQAKSLKLMANPVFWVEEPVEGGDVIVRLTDMKAKESPGGFRFRVRRTTEKACQIVGFPAPK